MDPTFTLLKSAAKEAVLSMLNTVISTSLMLTYPAVGKAVSVILTSVVVKMLGLVIL